jgi:fatty-acid desaturase
VAFFVIFASTKSEIISEKFLSLILEAYFQKLISHNSFKRSTIIFWFIKITQSISYQAFFIK